MVRRSTPQSKTDDLAFPVRVKVAVPGGGLHNTVAMHDWLAAELGHSEFAWHATTAIGTHASAVYFRSPAAAQRFLERFPDLKLADGTVAAAYRSPALPSGRR